MSMSQCATVARPVITYASSSRSLSPGSSSAQVARSSSLSNRSRAPELARLARYSARPNGSTACNSQPRSSATSAAIWSAPSAIGETKRMRGGKAAKQSCSFRSRSRPASATSSSTSPNARPQRVDASHREHVGAVPCDADAEHERQARRTARGWARTFGLNYRSGRRVHPSSLAKRRIRRQLTPSSCSRSCCCRRGRATISSSHWSRSTHIGTVRVRRRNSC